MCKTVSGFSASRILRNGPLKFPTSAVLDIAGSKKCRIFLGECLKTCQKLHGGNK